MDNLEIHLERSKLQMNEIREIGILMELKLQEKPHIYLELLKI